MKRRFLGRYNNLVTRHVVYATDIALEVDEQDNFSINRKRVFFEDVLLVTLHERIGIAPIFFSLGFGAVLMLFAVVAGGVAGWETAIVAMLFLINGFIRIRMKESIVTVFGRRSRARIRFAISHARAQRLYDEICERVRRAQAEVNPPAEPEPPQEASWPVRDQ